MTLAACSNIFGQKKLYFDENYQYAGKTHCNYAFVFSSDSGIRLDFYTCEGKIKYRRYYSKKFKPKRMDAIQNIRGREIEYNGNGKIIKEGELYAGHKYGIERKYNDLGNLISESNYFKNFKDGEEKEYFENGRLKHSRYFIKGKIHGVELQFDENGKITQSKEYYYGNCQIGYVRQVCQNEFKNYSYYSDGHLLKSIVLKKNMDTSSIYYYKVIDGRSSIDKCVYYKDNKIDSTFSPITAGAFLKNELKTNKADLKVDTVNMVNAKFIGGDSAFYDFIDNNLIFPESKKEEDIDLNVIVIFTISREGTILDLGSNTEGDLAFKYEAEKVIRLTSGKWIPAIKDQENVLNIFRIGIGFQLINE